MRSTRFVYDTGNRLRFTIDALGSVSENVYDAVGNVIVTTRFASRPTGFTSFTESDVDAAVDSLRSDGANQVTRFAYDADNRLRFTVDALGSVSENVYDAVGNVVVTTRFAARPTLRAVHRERDRRGGRSAARRPQQSDHPFRLRRAEPAALHRRCARLDQREHLRCAGQRVQHDTLCRTAAADAVHRKRDQRGRGDRSATIPAISSQHRRPRRGRSGPLQRAAGSRLRRVSPGIR